MQKKIIATTAVASVIITGISCNWFGTKPATKQPFSIIGKWQVDTVYQVGNDSSNKWLALAFLDTATTFKFNADSTFTILSQKDSTVDNYLFKGDTLFIKDDSTFVPFVMSKTNESLITITSKDSLVIALQRY